MTESSRYPAMAVLGFALVVLPGTVHADDRATVLQLFREGRELMQAGKASDACPKFEAAAQLSSTPGVRLNLAECWSKLGRTASAWGAAEDALALAERSGDTAAANVARKIQGELEPKLAYLTVTVAADAKVAGLSLRRDGQDLPAAAWGTAIPVDPGTHEIVAEAPGRERWSTTRQVSGAGPQEPIVVPALRVVQTVPPPPALATPLTPSPLADQPPEATVVRSGGSQRTMAWFSGGLGVIGMGLGSIFGVQAISQRNDYRAHLTAAGQCADATCQSDSHSAHTAGNTATVAFVAGGVFLAGGVVLWVTAPSGSHAVTTGITPVVAPGTAGLAMTGGW